MLGASVGSIAALAWSLPAHAQGTAPTKQVALAATSAASPHLVEDDTPGAGDSQQGRAAGAEEARHEDLGASLMLTGIVTFGLSYVPALYVGNDSNLLADRKLQIPVAGPWLDLYSRPGCGATGVNCRNESGYTALLMIDGLAQALSAIEVMAALVELAQEDPQAPKESEEAKVRVMPASFGPGGYGMAAIGKF
jgi:hypothetical protein